MPDPVGSTGRPAGSTGTTGSSRVAGATGAAGTRTPGGLDKDAFLKLLVAQLKFQNPLSPTDPSAFMAQTAQFTMVENLQAISSAQADAGAWQRVLAGQGLIGRTVSGGDIRGMVTGLTVTSDGAVLQLQGGTKLAVSDVDTVGDVPTEPR